MVNGLYDNHVCIKLDMFSSVAKTIKNLIDNSIKSDNVEIIGTVNVEEVDLFLGNYELKHKDFVPCSLYKTENILVKLKKLLIQENLFIEEELLRYEDIVGALSGAEGYKKSKFVLKYFSTQELDALASWVYAYSFLTPYFVDSLSVCMHSDIISNKKNLDLKESLHHIYYKNLSSVYPSLKNYTAVPPYYWILKHKNERKSNVD